MKSQTSKFLIITSSAGGGLLQAAVAQEQHILSQNPHVQIIKCDVLRDWVWSWLGNFCIESWNSAQKKGDVKSQGLYAFFHRFFDYVTWPNVFLHTIRILFKNDIDRVIDTQTTSTSAIMKAIRVFNWKKSKNVVLEKVVVDLPTKKATHFFRPVKSLSSKDKRYLKLRTILPLLEDGQTPEEFWGYHCGLSESDIHYEDVNVRQPFRVFQGKPRVNEEISISFHFKNSEELELMQNSYGRGTIYGSLHKNHIEMRIPREARVFTILLGSQPARVATLNYVKNFIHLANRFIKEPKPIYLFVFCADHQPHANSLFKAVSEYVKTVENYPSFLSIIPFSFQEDKVIAPLFHRCQATISRSGGGTAMELMAVSTVEIWIHSETKNKYRDLTLKELLNGIPVWESESAYYLIKLRNAKIITPETFFPQAYRLLKTS
jgi:hypothetical protein